MNARIATITFGLIALSASIHAQTTCSIWPSYLEPKSIGTNAVAGDLTVKFSLTDIPATMTFNRFAPGPFGVLEYSWSTYIDVDGNASTGATAKNGAEYQLVAGHIVDSASGSRMDAALPSALNYVKVLEWQPLLGIFTQSATATATATADVTANTVIISGKITGLGAQSKYTHQLEAYDGTNKLTNYNPVVPPAPCTTPPVTKFTIENGIIPPENATVTTSGGNNSLTVAVDLKLEDLQPKAAFAASRYNVFVAAMVPGDKVGAPSSTVVWFQKPKSSVWQALTSPISAFLENVEVSSQDQRVRLEIVRDTDLSTLVGTEFYIGYGTSDTEMLQSRRYRGIYKVQ